MDQKGGAMYN